MRKTTLECRCDGYTYRGFALAPGFMQLQSFQTRSSSRGCGKVESALQLSSFSFTRFSSIHPGGLEQPLDHLQVPHRVAEVLTDRSSSVGWLGDGWDTTNPMCAAPPLGRPVPAPQVPCRSFPSPRAQSTHEHRSNPRAVPLSLSPSVP